ncbi:helicase SEN [Spatholobus suberectus]|nr:helicase SEN [Spatholobus suberectus]
MKNLEHGNLLDIVFSWTLKDVLNENLFKHQHRGYPNIALAYVRFVAVLVSELMLDLWQATETKVMMYVVVELIARNSIREK